MSNYQTIVVGIDFSSASSRCLQQAARIAGRFGSRRLHLVHVVSMPGAMLPSLRLSSDATDRAIAMAEESLAAVEVQAPDTQVTREVRSGNPAQELARSAQQLSADLLVVAGRGQGVLAELVLGSVASSLIRVASCPTLVDVGKDDGPIREIVAAVDLSPISRNVIQNAWSMARRYSARVRVLSLFEHPLLKSDPQNLLPKTYSHDDIDALAHEHRRAVMDLIARVPNPGIDVEVEVMSKAPAANVIVDVAKLTDADLIVLGTSGQGAWHRMILGSTANFVLSRAPCPVLVVPHEVRQEAEETSPAALPA